MTFAPQPLGFEDKESMTNEEALAILEDGILSGKTDTLENNEAMDRAISALKSIDRITAERDAAVRDLKLTATCLTCKNAEAGRRCSGCLFEDEWEWRGIE